jgi:hypothetical protein
MASDNKPTSLSCIKYLNFLYKFGTIFTILALKNDGLSTLMNYLSEVTHCNFDHVGCDLCSNIYTLLSLNNDNIELYSDIRYII